MTVRLIPLPEFLSGRRTNLLLLGKKAGLREVVKLFPPRIGWTTVSCCNSTDFADNKTLVDRDKIQAALARVESTAA